MMFFDTYNSQQAAIFTPGVDFALSLSLSLLTQLKPESLSLKKIPFFSRAREAHFLSPGDPSLRLSTLVPFASDRRICGKPQRPH